MRLSIFRYNPEADQSPYTQDYEVALQPGDRMLLDVLMRIREQDDSKSCREGVCGSDGMNINGRNGLACVTPLAGLKEPVVLRHLPAIFRSPRLGRGPVGLLPAIPLHQTLCH